MGMYNEVFKKCPEPGCNGLGYTQIGQIVGGFGGFYLDNPESIAEELTLDEVHQLRNAVKDEWFVCQKCNESFQLNSENKKDEKLKVLNELNELNSNNKLEE